MKSTLTLRSMASGGPSKSVLTLQSMHGEDLVVHAHTVVGDEVHTHTAVDGMGRTSSVHTHTAVDGTGRT